MWMQKIFPQLTLLIGLTLSAFSYADCNSNLPIRHGLNSHFALNGQPFLSLNPEPKSIEGQNPGAVLKLTKVYESLRSLRSEEREIYAFESLENIAIQFPDPRFYVLIADLKRINGFSIDHFWELIVGCLFEGESIRLSQKIEGREIDILVTKEDGSQRWLEVKNWSNESLLDLSLRTKLYDQARKQNHVRRKQKVQVQLDLVLKYSLPLTVKGEFQRKTQFDQILVLFPEGLPKDTEQQ